MFNHEKKGIIQSIVKINGAVLIQGSNTTGWKLENQRGLERELYDGTY